MFNFYLAENDVVELEALVGLQLGGQLDGDLKLLVVCLANRLDVGHLVLELLGQEELHAVKRKGLTDDSLVRGEHRIAHRARVERGVKRHGVLADGRVLGRDLKVVGRDVDLARGHLVLVAYLFCFLKGEKKKGKIVRIKKCPQKNNKCW